MILEVNQRHEERLTDRERFESEAMDGPPARVLFPTGGRPPSCRPFDIASGFETTGELRSAQAGANVAWLHLSSSGAPGQGIVLDGRPILFGRNPDCQVVIHATAVSKKHAKITQIEGRFFIEDLSRNGTWVNNERIVAPRVQLNDNDQIKIGDFLCSFHEFSSPHASPAAIPPEECEAATDENSSADGDAIDAVTCPRCQKQFDMADEDERQCPGDCGLGFERAADGRLRVEVACVFCDRPMWYFLGPVPPDRLQLECQCGRSFFAADALEDDSQDNDAHQATAFGSEGDPSVAEEEDEKPVTTSCPLCDRHFTTFGQTPRKCPDCGLQLNLSESGELSIEAECPCCNNEFCSSEYDHESGGVQMTCPACDKPFLLELRPSDD
ncbi:hypothetical protein AYO40_05765 [Planctomycetaceae bacterium SCGC AG-212-D15]|nr:hypothetical protein AYO40_05765 [Planctomycetaceae bacterium SCGC AG-212-D15]